MKWEMVIGLETHVQLATRSKMFSGSPTAFGAPPNVQANAVDLALPGVLPVPNRQAVAQAIRFGLAVGAQINPRSWFERKNYFYPDLPKGYQISQYEEPVVKGGVVTFALEGVPHQVLLTRAHLEEDAGKSLHEDFHGRSGIDLNRAGTPLLEIVTEPVMRSAAEAVAYARTLHQLVTWIGICDGNMQEGSFRCDANVSVRPQGQVAFGTRCEIKNLNSFRFLEQAILHEFERQVELLESGGKVVQETRLYDPERDETRSMRSKEDAQDYRYFPDPDLPPLCIDEAWIEQERAALPELPAALAQRLQTRFGLSVYDAGLLTASREWANYFLTLMAEGTLDPKLCANWMTGELSATLKRTGREVQDSSVSAPQLAALLRRIQDGTLSGKMAREVFEIVWQEGGEVDALIAARGLSQVSDSGVLEKLIDELLAAHPAQVEEFRAGKDKVFGFFVGRAMKASEGRANPQQLNELLRRKLSGS
ncbi:Asp-tRNA(Asn)/Glu-tRNA(Gln) amidotransferase subunit GatB [Ferrovum myxofaciens]|uniref:Aspartyl/glutamyl-tRNA(Asn/Gln) amidotransferase subunit B n=2 Tax=root TaxID=1 RepID=A0A8F3E4J3_9PROT|nr:Asp-tRNA(Asn)/Glu-tRNA(Gln) amidotransferase subunit GatB [Ferrovum myxofaciens]KXW59395.1 aspartyl/glutamyl-tRNA(Asn/Gln) amidotransferase subunit B [Ferrovum myxofaciens]MBU6994326.1 Asp-tRNA(Asn)/Glu-tRNA(Gln) amidotransferase subunit GatB [Ferrovum myxofaciens]QKE38226.1 MAG: Asp-tRNA(Asn)/Glu-tRNA(Gln) amidotransferase subunit GatB [Ferrovum myxofaciens]QWY75956.1 MAG: Asp-tRNA(Asn)/Glu-tRNA(Gln) amidotransferase subunit GatB [Ferrovum myxofaciens]QWY78688.1 MAG: Asp-tRNA(Asn)/Glu-tRNA